MGVYVRDADSALGDGSRVGISGVGDSNGVRGVEGRERLTLRFLGLLSGKVCGESRFRGEE